MPDFSDAAPDLCEFQALRRVTGMRVFPDAAAGPSLERTLHGVWLRAGDGRLIGMGRVTGDGACFVQLNDVAVHPDHQGQGHGTAIVARLLGWCDASLPQGCYISLIADAGAERLYEKAGFAYRTGMARRVP
ncbi:GNAT family N-acetyltransferase [Actibacterium sp. D379-3]